MTVRLTPRGVRHLRTAHPWIYADDLTADVSEPGGLVPVEDPAGHVVAWGLYSPVSKIRVRLVSRGASAPGPDLWRERVERAVALRSQLGLLHPDGACRLVSGDADGIPGLVVDLYSGVCVLQSGTHAADRLRDEVAAHVRALLPFALRAVYERSDASVRRLEGLEPRTGLLAGELPGELVVREDELLYEVDVRAGHKTGHYLDQRENRRRAAALARGAAVLDAFSYDGLFGIRAALAGARSVLCVDQSVEALERARRNAERNGVAQLVRTERAHAMRDLRDRAAAGERYGLVVLDPPAFARNRRELPGAERGYRELNLRALRLLEPGGHLVSASCSHAVRPELFLAFLARAAADAGRDAWLERLEGAAPDHPALLTLPESAYLKCAFVRAGEPRG